MHKLYKYILPGGIKLKVKGLRTELAASRPAVNSTLCGRKLARRATGSLPGAFWGCFWGCFWRCFWEVLGTSFWHTPACVWAIFEPSGIAMQSRMAPARCAWGHPGLHPGLFFTLPKRYPPKKNIRDSIRDCFCPSGTPSGTVFSHPGLPPSGIVF